ncbi:MAG: 5-formyltetrahydrofolate cyclo-ligase [Chthoniobacteraceae bacterium]|jgi:5-formyltetrahydrofolate cyclo-ligase
MEEPTKQSLRLNARKLLADLSFEARATASTGICRQIMALPEWAAAQTVALYVPQPTEPDLMALLGADGKRCCFPRVRGDDELDFHECHSPGLLRPGRWRLLEPEPERCPIVPDTGINLFLIPGLAFTRSGGRLGRGSGFYDRFLKRADARAAKIGVCFHPQLVPSLPLEDHDRNMDMVLTEAEIIRC